MELLIKVANIIPSNITCICTFWRI